MFKWADSINLVAILQLVAAYIASIVNVIQANFDSLDDRVEALEGAGYTFYVDIATGNLMYEKVTISAQTVSQGEEASNEGSE